MSNNKNQTSFMNSTTQDAESEYATLLLKKQLKRCRTIIAILAVLLALAAGISVRCLNQLNIAREVLMDFQDNTQRLLSQKIETENKLSAVQKELAETQAQFKESFNVLYPAFVAVENIRYIGAGTNTYHRFDCILFSE